ncbi:MAG TPA: M15 family metallopeptidase [Candidatus Binataceae bacterium]|nr:M15 family metallopeptidase [Candidatus Binataceae bacterium]
MRLLLTVCFVLISFAPALAQNLRQMPSDFVDLHTLDRSIVVDIRYAGSHNFIGRPVPGYLAGKCYLTHRAAEAILGVQEQLSNFGLSLEVYDCYRPQSAVDYFVRWGKDPNDIAMKQQFYPHVSKDELIPRGYIASPSSHSRGSTLDLTIVGNGAVAQSPSCGAFDPGTLDMGTGFDCFDEAAHVHAPGISAQERANRMLLQSLMVQAGFKPLPEEWWHFTLKDEPYPSTYFDFPVK